MHLFDLSLQQLLPALAVILLFIAIFTGMALWWTCIIRSKMKSETSILWPIGLSLMSMSAFIGIGKTEPIDELTLILIAHIIAYLVIRRRSSNFELLPD